MEFTPSLIQERYDGLPLDVKRVIDSSDVGMKVAEIAKTFGLHVDQTGVLDEEIIFVMLGLRKVTEFQEKIQARLGVDDTTTSKLAQEINEKIFLPIKETLMMSPKSADDLRNRDEILSEIENPTPVEHPISIAKEVPAFPIAREVVSEKVPEKTAQGVAHDFINEKLTSTVNIPAQNTVVQPEKLPEKPKSYVADPYREPLI